MKRVVMLLFCCLVGAGSARAQTCIGGLSFSSMSPLQAGVGAQFSSNTHTFLGGVGYGTDQFFVRGGLTLTSASGLDGSAKGFVGSVGTELKTGSQGKLFVCPQLTIGRASIPDPTDTVSEHQLMIQAGGSLGMIAMESGTTKVIPTVSLSWNHSTDSFSGTFDGTSVDESFSTSFGTLQAGVGLDFNDRFALIPTVLIPFDTGGNSETSFVVLATFRLGK